MNPRAGYGVPAGVCDFNGEVALRRLRGGEGGRENCKYYDGGAPQKHAPRLTQPA